jgi:hypothetical protein
VIPPVASFRHRIGTSVPFSLRLFASLAAFDDIRCENMRDRYGSIPAFAYMCSI